MFLPSQRFNLAPLACNAVTSGSFCSSGLRVYAKGKILLSMTPACEVTPAKPGSRKVRDIEGGGCVGVCEGKELSPRLVVSTVSHN